MADENVSKEISIEENGTLESVNGNEEHSDVSSMQKDEEEEGKGDGLLFNDLKRFFHHIIAVVLDFIL